MIVRALDGKIEAAVITAQGRRAAMEDAHFLGVDEAGALVGGIFDGHNGGAVAELAASRLAKIEPETVLSDWLCRLHEEIGQAANETDLGGGACVVLFRVSEQRLELANVGDAELVSVSESGKIQTLTELHRLSNLSEQTRVRDRGALLSETHALDPLTGRGLMPTRCLGDHEFERIGIVCEPYTLSQEWDEGWLVAACDGLWDVVEAADLPEVLEDASSAESAVYRLALAAFDRGTQDNLTVIVLRCTKKGSEPALGALESRRRLGDDQSLRRHRRSTQTANSRELAGSVRRAR